MAHLQQKQDEDLSIQSSEADQQLDPESEVEEEEATQNVPLRKSTWKPKASKSEQCDDQEDESLASAGTRPKRTA